MEKARRITVHPMWNAPESIQEEWLWPDPETGPYLLRVTLDEVDGHLEPVGFEMWGRLPPDPTHLAWNPSLLARWARQVGVTALVRNDTLRVPLGRLVGDLMDRRTRALGILRMGHYRPELKARAERMARIGRPRRGRPPLYDDDHWKAVAQVYLAADGAPVRAVAAHFSVSRPTAMGWAQTARLKGFLPPAQ